MKKSALFILATLAELCSGSLAYANTITTSVNAASGPWDVSINPSFSYGVPVGGVPDVHLPPTVVDRATGLAIQPGDKLTIQYVSGYFDEWGWVNFDANGWIAYGGPFSGAGSPSYYTDSPAYLDELIGVFANQGVIVGRPFVIGDGPLTVTIPEGANQLLMGVNDGWYNDNDSSYSAQIQVTETPTPVVVQIDIKPGSYPNSINLGSWGVVPIAILGTATFDASTVDPTTVKLASAPVLLKPNGTPMSSVEDVNGDGLPDLVLWVGTRALRLSPTDTEAVLEGKTYSGTSIKGSDSVNLVPQE